MNTKPVPTPTLEQIAAQVTTLQQEFASFKATPGPQGPQGPAGPAGPQGPAGAIGAQGPQGQQGMPDPQVAADVAALKTAVAAIQAELAPPTPAPAPDPTPAPSPTPSPSPIPATTGAGAPVLSGVTITAAQNPVTADPNFVVLTRGDGRVVYHLGVLNPKPPADTNMSLAEHLGPYSINGFDVPCHWWNARWTDRSKCPIQITRSPAQLVSAKRMFPYAGVAVSSQPARVPYTLMGSSWLTVYMATTGERSDIGLTTDASAYAMLGGDPGSMIDAALAGETCPLHFRDQSTDQPIDLTVYPTANAYDTAGNEGSPWLCKGPPSQTDSIYSTFGGGWLPQQAHFTEMSYVAQMFTGDLGFLEDLQYAANFVVLTDSILAASSTPGRATPSGEYRGLAWAFRTLFMAHVATQDEEAKGPLPAYLKPSSYFKTLLDNALAYYGQAITDTTTIGRQTFHLIAPPSEFAPWEADYCLTALGFGILTGHSDWAPLYLWALNNAIDRLSGTSGYPPGYGCAYYLDATQPNWNAALLAGVANLSPPPTAAQIASLTADQFNGGVPMTGAEYLQTTRAVIVQAQYLDSQGILAVRKTFPNLDQCFSVVDKMIQNGGTPMEPRHAISADPTVAPSVIVPYQQAA